MLSSIGFKAGTEGLDPGDVTVESFFPLLRIFAWNLFSVQVLLQCKFAQGFGFFLLK